MTAERAEAVRGSEPGAHAKDARERKVRKERQDRATWQSALLPLPLCDLGALCDLGVRIRILAGLNFSKAAVRPDFGFFDDSDGTNAFATNECLLSSQCAGTILFGSNLIIEVMRELGRPLGDNALIGILAHEYAHIAQFTYGIRSARVRDTELHADLLKALRDEFGGKPFTASGIHNAIRGEPSVVKSGVSHGVWEALTAMNENAVRSASTIGKALSYRKDRIADGLVLRTRKDSHTKKSIWWVEEVP